MDMQILQLDEFLRSIKQNIDTPHSLLLGAGASIESGIPSAADCIWEWKREIYLSNNPGVLGDFDNSKSLNSKEAFYLALALSLDSLAVGFGSSLCSISYVQTLTLCFIIGVLCVFFGMVLGNKFSEKFHIELSWLSGLLLIILAVIRIIK